MQILRRNAERRHIRSGQSEMWLTFYPQESPGRLSGGFGAITILNEVRLAPNDDAVLEQTSESELVTYAYKGVLALVGPMGRPGVITAGEFQCMTIGRVQKLSVTNASHTDLAQFFRMYLHMPHSPLGPAPVEAQTRFTTAQRRNVLCRVASPDGRDDSLRIGPDAHVYSSILDPGQHVVYELPRGREAWVHIVHGTATANGVALALGDGMGIAEEPSVSVTVQEHSEILLIDTVLDFGETHEGMGPGQAGA
jgi:quercetin 2,3-dioxygenase